MAGAMSCGSWSTHSEVLTMSDETGVTDGNGHNAERVRTEDEALREAREELGVALDELKSGIDKGLAAVRLWLEEREHEAVGERPGVSPDVGGAVLALVGELPWVAGNCLSGDEELVASVRETLVELDGRLRAAGVEVGEGLTGFADRLVELRGQEGAGL
jgi:hypothetical protein